MDTDQQPKEVPPPKDPEKCYAIASLYYQGLTVPQDKAKAAALYELSADRGCPEAMVRLGIMRMEGDGVEQDYTEAAKLFQRAADRGNADGMYLLALLISDGKGVDRIPHEAAKWCFEAAKAGSLGAMVELATWFRDGTNFVQVDMQQCIYWLMQACLKEYAPAMYELGCMYAFGEGVKRDVKDGRDLLMHACLAGDSDAKEAIEALDAGAEKRPE